MRPHAKSFKGVQNLARDSFRDECDPNIIVRNYAQTGLVNHINRRSPEYGEAATMTFHEALCLQADIASRSEEGEFDSPTEDPVTDSDEKTPEKALQEPGEGDSQAPQEGLDKQSIPL